MSADGPVADGAADDGGEADRSAAAGAGPDGDGEQPEAPLVIRKRGRRVTTEPSPGYTGEPTVERHQSSENDDRLRGDLPPHWGKR